MLVHFVQWTKKNRQEIIVNTTSLLKSNFLAVPAREVGHETENEDMLYTVEEQVQS